MTIRRRFVSMIMMFSNDLMAKVRVRHEGTFENPDSNNWQLLKKGSAP
jgi:hypothetical protein